ncbi:phage tail length tape measure family protein [Enterovirga rhinocerotis]|uniref:Phage-related minor tail protein n=1 Tax=Enterovirga rhinocerotis TaxID=1339210 RepID=A0A4V3DXW4_9HYPH|nr:phage tail length tape measure family protein [Enterovirga rhinocerotis]TDR90289.1 phage-related minor tail protein [Enterovirga rhinocerotis]
MPNLDVIRRLEMRADVPGASEAAAKLRAMQGGFEEMARAASSAGQALDRNEKSVISTERAYDSFLKRTVPGYRELKQFERDVKALDQALGQGIGVQQFGRNFELARKKLPEVRAEMARVAAESAAIDRALQTTQRRIADSSRAWQEYRERIEAARHAQNSAEFGRSFRERVGAERPAATSQGASFSALEERARQEQAEQAAIDRAMVLRERQIAQRRQEEQERRAAIDTARYQQERGEFGRSLNERFGIGGPAATSRGASFSALADRAVEEQRALRAEADRVTEALREQQVEFDRLGRTRNELLQRADPLGAAQERHNQALADAKRLVDQRRISEAQYLAIVEHEADVLRRVNQDFGAGKGGFRAHQRTNLAYQANDVIGGLIMGQSPFMVAAQQGPQIAQILGDHEGGVRGGLKALKDDLLGMVTPARVAFGGLVALAGAAAYSVYRLEAAQQQLRISLTGRGYGSGLTLQGLNELAERNAGPGNLTYGGARDLAGVVARSGIRDSGLMDRVMQSARDYSITTGQDAVEGSKEWAQAIADPVRGLEMLEERLGRVDAGTATFIRTQALSGNRLTASTALMDAFSKRLANHREILSGLPLLWDTAKKGLDALIETLNKGVRPPEVSITDRADPQRMGQIGAQQAMNATVAAMQQRDADRRKREEDAAAASRDIQGIAEGIDPDIGKLRELGISFDKLFASRNDPDVIKNLEKAGISADKYREIIERAGKAKETSISADQRASEQHEINLRSIRALTAGEEAAIAADQKRLEAKGDITKAYRAETDAILATTEALARYEKAAADALRQSQYSLKTAGLLPMQRTMQAIANEETEELLRNRGASAKTIADIRERFANRRREASIENSFVPQRDFNMRLEEMRRGFEFQRDSFGQAPEAVETMRARLDMLNEATRYGQSVTDRYGAGWEALAAQMGRAKAATDELALSQQNAIAGMDEMRSGSRGLLTGMFSDLRQGKSPIDGLINGLGRMQDQMFERMISKPLIEGLMGRDGTGNGGWLSGLLQGTGLPALMGANGQTGSLGDVASKVLGIGQTATGTMSVTAGVVNIGGAGIGGLIPGLGGRGAAGMAGIGGGATVQAPMSAAGTIVSSGGRVLSFTRSGSGSPITSDPGVILPYREQTPITPYPVASVTSSPLSPFQRGEPVQLQPPSLSRDLIPPSSAELQRRVNMPALNRPISYWEEQWRFPEAGSKVGGRLSDDYSTSATGAGGLGFLREGLERRAQVMRNGLEHQITQPIETATNAAGGAIDVFKDTVATKTPALGGALTGLVDVLGSVGKGAFSLFGASGASAAGPSTGFSGGGYTGPGGMYEPRGIVHAGEVVWSQHDVARAGGPQVVDAMRRGVAGYAVGGEVWPATTYAAPVMPSNAGGGAPIQVSNTVHNYAGAQVEQRETRGPDGQIQLETFVRAAERRMASKAGRNRGEAKDVFLTNQAAMNRG